MADNYLENKMEEHRRGAIRPAVRSTVQRAGVLAPGLHLQFPPMWIVLLAHTADDAEPYLAAMRGAGLSVALCCSGGGREANVLAQKLGARLYPDSCSLDRILAELAKNGNRPAHIVNLRADECHPGAIRPSALADGIPASVLARELLFMLHPEHINLLKAQRLFDIQD